MQTDQFWISRKGHVRRRSYLLRTSADKLVGASISFGPQNKAICFGGFKD
jgi:hypothetical protein